MARSKGVQLTFGDLLAPPRRPIRPAPKPQRPSGVLLAPGAPSTGAKAKATGNLAALRLLRSLTGPPSPPQRLILAQWVGWGALPGIFDEDDKAWRSERAELRTLVDAAGWDAARRSTINAHYTDPQVASALWTAVTDLGFPGGRVLEPGCGSGVFMDTAPGLSLDWTGVELDPTTAAVCAALHPHARILPQGFETARLDAQYDLAIGNVPFGAVVLHDSEYNRLGLTLHNYFTLKSLALVKPGGLVALITSRYTLDAQDDKARRAIDSLADFVGAVRTPAGTFRRVAGTEAVTDLVIFRKREDDAPARSPNWKSLVEVQVDGQPASINEWYRDHPEYLLGRLAYASGMYRAGVTLLPRDEELAPVLTEALASVVANSPLRWGAERVAVHHSRPVSHARDILDAPKPAPVILSPVPESVEVDITEAKEGAILLSGGRFLRIVNGRAIPYLPTPLSDATELRALVGLRDTLMALLDAQARSDDDSEHLGYRRDLNRRYDLYAASYGPLNRYKLVRTGRVDPETEQETHRRVRPRMGGFAHDPDFYSLLALESFDPDSQTAVKAPIFTQRVVSPRKTVSHAESAQDALSICLDRIGRVDLDVIAVLLGTTADEARAKLGNLIYRDPVDGFVTATTYLSGNVRTKLDQAREAASRDARWMPNVEALEAVQPIDLTPEDIDARLGCTWIPVSDVEKFARVTFSGRAVVDHSPLTSTWAVQAQSWERRSVAATSTWGTPRAPAHDILEASLNQRSYQVFDRDAMGNRVLNAAETLAAREKQEDLEARFGKWVWEDEERSSRLAEHYNRLFNSNVLPAYDGSHLTLPGMNSVWRDRLHQHQRDAIWQIICEPTMLLAHAVGAGKAQPMDAKVLTPQGFRRMGDLMVGDEVISADGTPTAIVGVFPQGPLDNYRVTFTDGATTECSIDHLWQVIHADGKGRGCAPKVMRLLDLLEDLTRPQRGKERQRGALHYRWEVPMPAAAEFDCGIPRPLDPYWVGLLIGDGNCTGASVRFTSADPELVDAFRDGLPSGYTLVSRSDPKRPYDYRVSTEAKTAHRNQVITWLYELGLMGMGSHHKHIPQAYKEAPSHIRLAVLQGLMDTDGTIDKRQAVGASKAGTLTTVSARLAEDVAWIVRSLGGTCRPYKYVKQLNGVDHPVFQMTISLPAGIPPFRLERKAQHVQDRTKYPLRRAITTIERIGRKPMQCIAVAHPSRLYVTDDFIVTHNTASIVASAVELRRLGFVSKPCIVVPNHMLDQFATEMLQLYPLARVLVATKAEITPAKRKEFVARCATGDWDAIIITHSAFERIPTSNNTRRQFLAEKASALRAELDRAKGPASKGLTVKKLELATLRADEKHKALMNARSKDDGVTFEESGIDYVFYDEAQGVKNLALQARSRGMASAGSQRAEDISLKLAYLRSRHGRRIATFATGTPITNTLAEMYVMQSYLQPERLLAAGVPSFDAWAANFGKTVTALELAPDGGSYRLTERFARFRNIPELLSMFRAVADVRSKEDMNLPVPAIAGGEARTVVVPGSRSLAAYVETLVARARAVKAKMVRPEEDNMLVILSDGRKAALHLRLVGEEPEDDGKLGAAAVEIAKLYKATRGNVYTDPTGRKSTRTGAFQLVFCDMGTPKPDGEWSVYKELRDRITAQGVPESKVRFVHDAKDDRAKAELFAACRDGRVSVLIGSTEKMGTGTNIQTRMVAIHHIDCPWRPDLLEQREGRGIRQGNQNAEIAVLRYVVEASFDVFMWGTVERKSAFIYQVMRGRTSDRDVEDVGEITLDYAQVKALATGNPLVMEKAGVDNDVARLTRKRRAHEQDQVRLARALSAAQDSRIRLSATIAACQVAIPRREDTHADLFRITLEDAEYEDRREAGAQLLALLRTVIRSPTVLTITGEFAGFDLILTRVSDKLGRMAILRLEPAPIELTFLESEIAGTEALSLMSRLERRIRDLDTLRDASQSDLERVETELRGAEERLGQPFDQALLLEGLLRRQAEIDKELADTMMEEPAA